MFLVLVKVFAVLLPLIIGFILGRLSAKKKMKVEDTKNKQYIKFFTYKDKAFYILNEDYNSSWFEFNIGKIKSEIINRYIEVVGLNAHNILITFSNRKAMQTITFHEISLEETLG